MPPDFTSQYEQVPSFPCVRCGRDSTEHLDAVVEEGRIVCVLFGISGYCDACLPSARRQMDLVAHPGLVGPADHRLN